tara:strand:- start:2048 stop:2350 length:303 start_codon:yes stop_codon:yes gene_type:complete
VGALSTTGSEIISSKVPKKILQLALSRELRPTIRIGKSGITDNLMSEISAQLSSKSLVKIKINRGLFEKNDLKSLWLHLSETTDSVIVSIRGNVGVLWKQ